MRRTRHAAWLAVSLTAFLQPIACVRTTVGADLYGDPLPAGAVARLGSYRFAGFAEAVAYSADGRSLAVLKKGSLRINVIDASTGEVRLRLDQDKVPGVPANTRLVVSYSPDGRAVASNAGWWDARSGNLGRAFDKHELATGGVDFSPDGHRLATACADGKVRIWRMSDGNLLLVSEPYENPTSLRFSPDGRLLAILSDGKGYLLDAGTGGQIRELAAPGWVHRAVFSPDGRTLAALGRAVIYLWDLPSLDFLYEIGGNSGQLRDISFSEDGQRIVSIGERATCVWHVDTARRLVQIPVGGRDVAFSPDNKTIVTAGGRIQFWNATTGREVSRVVGHSGEVRVAAFTPDGQRVLTIGEDGAMRRWDAGSGKPLQASFAEGLMGLQYAISSDTQLAAVGDEHKVRIYQTDDGRLLDTWRPRRGYVTSLAFSPDGRTLIRGDFDKILLWDLTRAHEFGEMSRDEHGLPGVAVSPDGKLVFSASSKGEVCTWNMADGRLMDKMKADPNVQGIALSKDGRRLAIASGYNEPSTCGNSRSTPTRIQVLNAATGNPLLALGTHRTVRQVAFSPDGGLMAAVTRDGAAQLWEVDSGAKLLDFGGRTTLLWRGDVVRRLLLPEFPAGDNPNPELQIPLADGHRRAILSIDFSPDGKRLVTTSSDSTALVWDIGLAIANVNLPEQIDVAEQWQQLAVADNGRARRAVMCLTSGGSTAVQFIERRIRPAQPIDRQRFAALIADLDADSYAKREAASRTLNRMGSEISYALADVHTKTESPEVRARINVILASLLRNGEGRQKLLGIEVLQRIGTAQAIQVLQSLAAGGPSAEATRAAAAALEKEKQHDDGMLPSPAVKR